MPLTKWVLLFFLFITYLSTGQVFAGCEVSASTSSFLPNSSANFTINLKNTGDAPITFVRAPIDFSSRFTGVDVSIQDSGWIRSENGKYISGDISPNETISFSVSANTSGEEGSSGWNWETSVNFFGDPVDSCGLNLTVSSSTPTSAPAPTSIPAPSISSTNLSIGNNYAILTWTTSSDATGNVSFGQSTSYGNTVTTASNTAHSATLGGLSPSTTYHFQILATGPGGSVLTNDATFTTSAANVTTVVSTTVTNTVTVTQTSTSAAAPTPRPLIDTVAPVINIKNDFSKPFAEAPAISGRATDGGDTNVGVVSLDYSLDGGKNWLPVDVLDTPNQKTTTFEFTPVRLDDGNYKLKLRAKDSTGNTGTTKIYNLIIDRLPPQVGASLFTLGPLILKPDQNGNIFSLAGQELKIILSAVGGPTSMDMYFDSQKFPFTKNDETGLWTSLLKPSSIGTFRPTIKSIDGAKNETTRQLNPLNILPPGIITDTQDIPINNATIKVYIFDKTTNRFSLWESAPFLQTNPQTTTDSGQYQLLLPPGKYYLEVTAKGKQSQQTPIFEINTTTAINQQFRLNPNSFFYWWPTTVNLVVFNNSSNYRLNSPLIGTAIPDFDLSNSNRELTSTSILGKPTVLSFFTSWEPQTSDQLRELDEVATNNSGINTVAVASQESTSKIDIFKKIGGYQLPIVADPDGVLILPLNLESLPTHLFLDRKGIIKDVLVGFINKNTLLNTIIK